MRNASLAIHALFFLFGCSHVNPHAGQPKTAIKPIVNTYHNTRVVDDYQWLEDWQDPKVKTWTEAENRYARKVLDNLPSVNHIRTRVKALIDLMPVTYRSLQYKGGRLFAIKVEPPFNQPFLVVVRSPGNPQKDHVVLDPNKVDQSGSVSIDWYRPSHDGKRVAVSLSTGGFESGDLHIYDTDTGGGVGEVVPRVNSGTAGGDVGWTPDGEGFYYTRNPRQGERPSSQLNFDQQVWFHQLGTSIEEDRYELGRGFPRIAEIEIDVQPSTGLVLATVQMGDGGGFAHHIRWANGEWKQITEFGDGMVQGVFGPMGSLFFITRLNAPNGKVLYLPSTDMPIGQARRIVVEGKDALVSDFYRATTMVATKTRLYAIYQLGGPSEIRVFDHTGRRLKGPDIPALSSVGQHLIPTKEDDILFSLESYVDSPKWYRFSAKDETTKLVAMNAGYPLNFSDVEVIRERVVSSDGTKVPINIIRKKGIKLDRSHPVLLTGYGGFGVSKTPKFDPMMRIWLDHGGVWAVANIRGGGEFGDMWHKNGMGTSKQNVFDDFYACMKYLVDVGYTTEERLAIQGGSNGGLLMGAMITQHPESVRAVISRVGIYDMLRYELEANGQFNVPEYGTVKDPDGFRALLGYSPYHRVKDRVEYPAVLFMTGANDPRVNPMHSRKMTARLQKANLSDLPILLRTSSNTGHGHATPLSGQIEKWVDMLSFLFYQLKIENNPVELK